MGLIEKHANSKDLKSIRFMAIHFLEAWKKEFVKEYGIEAWQELYDRYNITRKIESLKDREKKISALKAFGFKEEDAEVIANLSKAEIKNYVELVKAKAYSKQTDHATNKAERERQEKNKPRIRVLNRKKAEIQRKLSLIEEYRNEKGSLTPVHIEELGKLEGQLAEINKELEQLGNP